MFKRWMTGWLAIWLIASMGTIQAQSQSTSDSDPDTLRAITFPTPIIDLADLFPTRSGLIWEYSGSPLKTARRISMVGVERSLPPLTYLWEGFMGTQRIRKTDDGKIMEIIGETYEFETAFVLQDNWNKNTPSFLLSSHLTVSLDDGDQVTSDMTEAIVKFAIDGWAPPAPGQPGPLSASLEISREQYTASDIVNINYHLTNTSEEPITLAFNSGQRYDLVLNGPQGAIWGWSWTRLFTAETGELLLAPGDSFAFEETIALSEIPNLADGVYVLRVYMTSTDELADDTEAKSRFWLGDTPPTPTPTPVPLPVDPTASEGSEGLKRTGDFDANGQVDFADFLNFASAFGTTIGMADYKTDFDLDSDGQIAFSDFLTFASVFGK